MNKRTRTALILIGVITLLAVLCGTVLAYMFRQTQEKDNRFEPGIVSCKVHEVTDSGISSELTEKSSIKIENTGNIAAYLRVRFVSYWVQTAADGSTDIAPISSEMPVFEIADGWIEGSNDTYYYTTPVSPGQLTDELLSQGTTIPLAEKDGYLQVIEVFAEAIQSQPESSVTESWPVTLDENGVIISSP